jgi:hypothetical protein
MLAVFTVTNPADAEENTTAAAGTLRQAVSDANQSPDGDTINFALPAGEDRISLTLGDLNITEALIINGPGRNVDGDFEITISGNHSMTKATWSDGDLDGDGVVGDADLDLAFAQYGMWLDVVA